MNSDLSAAVLGSLFPVGRIFYARHYPTGHRPGFLIQLFSEIALFLAVSFGLVFLDHVTCYMAIRVAEDCGRRM